jgi:hypothetical protein
LIAEVISGFSNKLFYIALLVLMTRFMSKNGYEMATLLWFSSLYEIPYAVME